MYDNKFVIKDGIIYDTTYGCSKKYRCTNAMWILSVLEFTYIVIIDRCTNATDNGRSKVEGVNGSDKTYFKQKCA